MTHKTKGIVLRTVKYGETSLVATVFTELFGLQVYMVKGVRSAKNKKAGYFVSGAILDMVVYHHEHKNMQMIKEFSWAVLFRNVLSDVIKNSVALYMVELLHKCLKQPEQNTALFYFFEDALLALDEAPPSVAANFPLYFTLHLPHFFGFRIQDNYNENFPVLDLQEGCFEKNNPHHPHFIEGEEAAVVSHVLKAMQPHELADIKLNHQTRRKLLQQLQVYYALHIPDFGQMKTLAVLSEVL
jgi:DNA repair protein RecO (recombination protein O)